MLIVQYHLNKFLYMSLLEIFFFKQDIPPEKEGSTQTKINYKFFTEDPMRYIYTSIYTLLVTIQYIHFTVQFYSFKKKMHIIYNKSVAIAAI